MSDEDLGNFFAEISNIEETVASSTAAEKNTPDDQEIISSSITVVQSQVI